MVDSMNDSKFGGNDRGLRNDMNAIAKRFNAQQKIVIRRSSGKKQSVVRFYVKPARDYNI